MIFLKLRLMAKDGKPLSDNFYWLGDNRRLNDLAQASLGGSAKLVKEGEVEITVKNTSKIPCLLLKPTLRNAKGERILPAFVSEGGFSLLPEESRTFRIETPKPEGAMKVTFEGWNNAATSLPVKP